MTWQASIANNHALAAARSDDARLGRRSRSTPSGMGLSPVPKNEFDGLQIALLDNEDTLEQMK